MAATVAIASGADVKSVQNMLGHATASFTLNVYAHTSERMMADTASTAQGYYDRLKSGINRIRVRQGYGNSHKRKAP